MNDITTTANKPPILVLRERLEARKEELRNALPDDIRPEQFIRALITSAQLNPDLLACSWQSMWLACMRACRDGLVPDGTDGAIVPYKDKATWIPMYQGLLRRFRRSGQFKEVAADIVRQGEEFHYYRDQSGTQFRHVPGDSFSAPIAKIYATATTKDGGFFIAVLTIDEANKIRNMSRTTREDSPWKVWPEEMYKKTALRRLSKYLPSARDLMGDDEDELPEFSISTTAAPATSFDPGSQRSSGAASALQQFAGTTGAAAETAAPAGDGERGPAYSNAEADLSVAESAPEVGPAAIDPIQEAHRRGQEAKAANHRRTAVPGEYRNADRMRENDAWVAGYDGKPIPGGSET